MPPIPPLKLVLESLQSDVLPAAGVGAFVMCVCLLFGRWAAALGAALAISLAFMSANFTMEKVGFDEQPTWENTGRLIPWKPAETDAGWKWQPRAALVLVCVGLLSRWFGLITNRILPERFWWVANVLVWLPRVAAVYVVSEWLVRGTAASDPKWVNLRIELAAAIVAIWIVLDGVARAGAGTEIAAYLGLSLFIAATILIYAHSKLFMDLAVIFSFAMFGIAAAAALGKADTSGAIPAGAVALPGLVLGTRPSMEDHNVPIVGLWLVALAPLVLVPFLVPALSRKQGRLVKVIRFALILAPLITAVILAMEHEKLAFDEEG